MKSKHTPGFRQAGIIPLSRGDVLHMTYLIPFGRETVLDLSNTRGIEKVAVYETELK